MGTKAAKRGFTLLEVLVAGVIFTITSMALAATIAQGSAMADAPRTEIMARNAMREVVATIASASFDRAALDFHGRAFDVPGLRAVQGDPDGLPGEIAFAYGPGGNTNMYAVTVRVRWRGRHGERVIENTHYLANVRGDTGTPRPLEELGQGGIQTPMTFGDYPRTESTVNEETVQ